MMRTGAQIKETENQSKFIQNRISQVEHHFGNVCLAFGSYHRRCSKMRDSGDEVCRTVMDYCEQEHLNHTTKHALREFSQYFSGVQDYRESQVKRLDAKVVEPLTMYGDACKQAKQRLKAAFAAQTREMKKKKSFDKVKENSPSDAHQVSLAKNDLQRAQVDVSYTTKQLEEEMDSFEKKKLEDIKKILVDFVNVEMVFHAKALEMYTQCHRALTSMNEEEDLEEFRSSLRPSSTLARLDKQHAASKNSLNTTSGMSTSNGQRGPHTDHTNGTMYSTTMNTTSQSMYSDTQVKKNPTKKLKF
ncbi:hypothetical protein CAPTEDRAFT_177557 [Capitella teleta]|uniref:BAR domain-containing protein n=1 Tax=Capitella teleta TaxID=283909 RepID=R7TL01_CAPTE|nr:hypothetical protein CAPTEDRAFT_177557 [Capitella teleta]|eukprot:ELT91785.1 hypothetical protein CAPTEDRAFT_177557 [Capitella teleta]